MLAETKTCQNCKKDFTTEPDDFGFYEKIKVPPPTFCPDCRFLRRMAWRNDWHMFRKRDALTGEMIFSLFPEESPVKIYDRDYWLSDNWDPCSYGRDFDFSKPFFEQFKELLREVPLPAHSMHNIVNCHYCTNANNLKNCYLVRGSSYTEDSAYLIWDQESKQCMDSHMTNKCELSYGNVNTVACYRTIFSVDCESSVELMFCKDCVGCNNCVASIGLRNKSYCIFNQQYDKEKYQEILKELDLGSYKKLEEFKEKAYAFWLSKPQKYIHGHQNLNVSGDYIYESKNAKQCYRVRGVEDSKFIQNILTGTVKSCYDYANYGDNVELVYESLVVGSGGYNVKFSSQIFPDSRNMTYCFFCNSGSDLFGCISLRKKKYCVLNKQYTKEEYEKLIPKIIEHMKQTGEWGEFFPVSLSPFPYQTTAAYEFSLLTEEESRTRGFSWYPTSRQEYKVTLKEKDIPDNIKDVKEDILEEVFECAHKETCQHECTGAFRVIKEELDFLKRMNISLPRLCVNCRHYERLKLRNSPNFYKRFCMCDKENHTHQGKCEVEFETSYAPERPEIVYCEKCYQQEVY